MNNLRSQQGFTLIETLLYMGLVGFLIGSAIAVTFELVDGQSSLNSRMSDYHEGMFLMGKIEWALSGVSTVNVPLANTTNDSVSVTKSGYGQNPVVIDLNNGDLRISKNGASPIILNNSWSEISSVSFTFNESGTTKSISASLYVNGEKFETYRLISR